MSGAGTGRLAGRTEFERRLLGEFQRDFPLTPQPFAEIAARLHTDETSVLDALARLQEEGAVSRVGAVIAPHRAGSSTLSAMAVPAERLEEVAALVSAYPEVNHNYEREHELNLWFVVAAPSAERVAEVRRAIEARTGLEVIDLPLIEAYRLDTGFALQWT